MERWMAPGITMSPIEKGKDEGAYEVTMEKNMTPTENEAVEEGLGKKEGGPEQEAKGGGESEAGMVGVPMEIKKMEEQHQEDEEKHQGDEEQASKKGIE